MAKSDPKRRAKIDRKTKETDISLTLDLDGSGESSVDTGIPFLDHMLNLVARHGFFDLTVQAKGDLAVDDHHTVEDIGICLGQALNQALGDKAGLRRFGHAAIPLDEAMAEVTADLSGRSFLVMKCRLGKQRVGTFSPELVDDFISAFVSNAAITLHINVPYGRNAHHKIECLFKALARALAEACSPDPRQKGIPSTKGML
jgi:imidazoleglycerol-phosphate dehydratase